MRRSRRFNSSSLSSRSVAVRLCLLACAFAATAAAVAAASPGPGPAADAFLAAVLSLGPSTNSRNRRSAVVQQVGRKNPVELTHRFINSLGLCPSGSNSSSSSADFSAIASRLEALSSAWLRLPHCGHLSLASVLPMFPRPADGRDADQLPGLSGSADPSARFDSWVPAGGCSALLLEPAAAIQALLSAASATSSVTTATSHSSTATPPTLVASTAAAATQPTMAFNATGSANPGSFINEDSPLQPPPPSSSLSSSPLIFWSASDQPAEQSAAAAAANLSRLACQCAQAVLARAARLGSVSAHFNGLLSQMYFKARSAETPEHLEGLKLCRAAYSGWLCSVYFSVHNTSREAWQLEAIKGRFAEAAKVALMKPCPDWCQAVETECPYVAPSEDVSNSGEPLFLCHEDSYKGPGFTDRCREAGLCCCYQPVGAKRGDINFTCPAEATKLNQRYPPDQSWNSTAGNATDQASSGGGGSGAVCKASISRLLLLSALLTAVLIRIC